MAGGKGDIATSIGHLEGQRHDSAEKPSKGHCAVTTELHSSSGKFSSVIVCFAVRKVMLYFTSWNGTHLSQISAACRQLPKLSNAPLVSYRLHLPQPQHLWTVLLCFLLETPDYCSIAWQEKENLLYEVSTYYNWVTSDISWRLLSSWSVLSFCVFKFWVSCL